MVKIISSLLFVCLVLLFFFQKVEGNLESKVERVDLGLDSENDIHRKQTGVQDLKFSNNKMLFSEDNYSYAIKQRGTQKIHHVSLKDDDLLMTNYPSVPAKEEFQQGYDIDLETVLNKYEQLSSVDEKIKLLNGLENVSRSVVLKSFQYILQTESSVEVKAEVISLVGYGIDDSGQAVADDSELEVDDFEINNDSYDPVLLDTAVGKILEQVLVEELNENLRLKALYYAQDTAPHLISQFIDDPSEIVRGDARTMYEEIYDTDIDDLSDQDLSIVNKK